MLKPLHIPRGMRFMIAAAWAKKMAVRKGLLERLFAVTVTAVGAYVALRGIGVSFHRGRTSVP